ncbi:aspartate/glutamate racemase family protein [Streptomyces exfoliatus]|uniref:aspartate/glutamate racemase family protein n=1 Tax=Streptomyces exfoliatus TaxID=1905 RepID=UPI001F51F82C|nr:aspartate/glutamate racemase family protein [Streptomyces exfoliatus]
MAGLGEAALLEAAAGGQPSGIATTTPLLADAIAERVASLGLADRYTGVRLTAGSPERLSADPALLLDRLERAVRAVRRTGRCAGRRHRRRTARRGRRRAARPVRGRGRRPDPGCLPRARPPAAGGLTPHHRSTAIRRRHSRASGG